jgi:hypothetical protein
MDYDHNPSTIPDNDNDRGGNYSESDDEPLRQPSRKAMGKRPSKYSFISPLAKQATATQSSPTLSQPLHPEHREVIIVSEEEDECEPVPLAHKKVSH